MHHTKVHDCIVKFQSEKEILDKKGEALYNI